MQKQNNNFIEELEIDKEYWKKYFDNMLKDRWLWEEVFEEEIINAGFKQEVLLYMVKIFISSVISQKLTQQREELKKEIVEMIEERFHNRVKEYCDYSNDNIFLVIYEELKSKIKNI